MTKLVLREGKGSYAEGRLWDRDFGRDGGGKIMNPELTRPKK